MSRPSSGASMIKGLARHALADKKFDQFPKDWAANGQSIP